MRVLNHLFEKNRQWASRVKDEDPEFFHNLAAQQSPDYLWIGCSDSRAPANQIVDLAPGELFVHRNVANVVIQTDFNCLSVLQYAVDVLKVKHVMVVGHYGCGGVKAALEGQGEGLIRNWLSNVREVYDTHRERVDTLARPEDRVNRLCELNVVEQVRHVCQTSTVQDAWKRGQTLSVHGWIYDIRDGLLQDLTMCITGADEVGTQYAQALNQSPSTS